MSSSQKSTSVLLAVSQVQQGEWSEVWREYPVFCRLVSGKGVLRPSDPCSLITEASMLFPHLVCDSTIWRSGWKCAEMFDHIDQTSVTIKSMNVAVGSQCGPMSLQSLSLTYFIVNTANLIIVSCGPVMSHCTNKLERTQTYPVCENRRGSTQRTLFSLMPEAGV